VRKTITFSQKVWKWLSHIDTLQSLLAWSGLWKAMTGALLGIISGGLAFLQSLSPLIIFFAVIGSIAIGLWGANEFTWQRLRRRARNQGIPFHQELQSDSQIADEHIEPAVREVLPAWFEKLFVKGVRTMYRQGGEKVYQQRGADPRGFTSSGGLGEGREAA
jgi:hypothetical protein